MKKHLFLLATFIGLQLQAAPAPSQTVPLPKPRSADVNRISPTSDPNDLFEIKTDSNGQITARSKEYFKTDEEYVVTGDSVLVDNKIYKNGTVIHKGATIPGNTHFVFPPGK